MIIYKLYVNIMVEWHSVSSIRMQKNGGIIMKQGKKILSIFLAVLMIFGCVQVGVMPLSLLDAEAATAASVKSKLTAAVATKIATKGSEGSNVYTYTGDDGSVMAAAEEVYAYATGVRGGTGTTSSRNATTTIMSKVASDTGYTSGNNNVALRRLINPNGTTVYGYENRLSKSGSKTVNRTDDWNMAWKDSFASYNGSVSTSVTKTVSIKANLESVLLTYSDVASVPSTILLDVKYTYGMTRGTSLSKSSSNKKQWGVVYAKVWSWTTYAWNYLNSVSRTVNSQNTTAAGDLQAFNSHFVTNYGAYLDDSVYDLVTTFTPAELTALISANNTAYNRLNSYSDSVKTHFFNMTQIKTFMDNVVYAEKVANAMPAIDAFNNAMAAGYDAQDLAGMESMYATLTPHLENLNSYEADVLAYVGANFPGYESFSLDNARAFYAQLEKDIELYKLREIKATVDALRATYPDAASIAAIDTDAEGNYINENLTLLTLDDKVDGYYTALTNGTFTDENIATVFTEGVSYVKTFADETQWEIEYRNAAAEYVNFYDWFIPLTYADLTKYESAVIYGKNVPENVPNLPNAESKRSAYITMYNKYEALIGTPAMEEIFGAGEEAFINVIDAYIASLKACMEQRVADQLDPLSEYVNDTALVIDFSNFVLIKSLLNNVDHDLYADAKARGLVNSDRQKIYNALNNLLVKYNAFVESGGLNNFKQNHYHDAENIYTIRYAGDQGLDENGDQIGYPNDVARDGTEDNYIVDVNKVNETIVKLDSFLTSEDFCALVGFKDEEDNPYSSLSEAIDDIIQTNLFTNELINSLVANILPMLQDALVGLLLDLSKLNMDGIGKPTQAGSVACIDVGVLAPGTASGKLHLYLDGSNGTVSLQSALETLGLYLYPSSFAKKLPSDAKYNQLRNDLNKAGKNWNYFYNAEEEAIVLDYDWGVHDYNTFVNEIGVVFSSILPLLQALLVGRNYSATVTKLAYGYTPSLTAKVDASFLGTISATVWAKILANATITIPGQNLYKTLLIPLLEQLGVTDGGYDLSGLGMTSNTYTFRTLSQTASAQQIANAIFEPILVLIEQLKNQPIAKLTDMLPSLVYLLSMDGIQDMIDAVTINLSLKLQVNDIVDIGWVGSSWADFVLDLLKDTIKGILNDNLPAFDMDLKLSSMVNLVDLLGFEYTNLNELLAFLLETLGMDVELPIINAGEIITCASVNKNATSQGGNGKRIKFTADRADVFYFLLQYIVSAVGDRTFVEDLIGFIAYSEAELTVDTDGDGEPDAPAPEDIETIELPELVYQIINNVHHNPMNALAALVELFVPQEYDKEDIDWVASQYDYAGIDGMNDASIIYLTYGNDWQKSDAEYLIENVDAILESVLEMTGSEQTQINALIQDGFNNILTNDVITGLISVLSSLGTALGEEFIYELIDRELEVDLTAMYDAFGYLFVTDEDRQAAAEAGEEFVEPLKPGEAGYENIYAITATASEEVNEETGETETVITWSYNGTEFVDGDIETFTDLLCEAIKEFAPVLATMLSGDSIGLFDDAIEFLGYENYADSIGILFEVLGIEDVMDQAAYEAYCDANGDVAALNYTVKQLFNWFDGYILEGNTVQKIVELLPNIVYAIESNALSTVLHNLLMPVLIILDTVRPIIDIDLNSIASLLVSDLINYGEIDTDVLLQFIEGVYVNDDLDYKWFNIDLGALTLENIISIVDTLLGTNLYGSQLVNPGLKSLCSGIVEYDSVLTQTAYKCTMDAPDALTIVLSAVLEAAEFVTADGRTNGQIICDLIDEGLVADGKEAVAGAVYAAVTDLIKGVSVEYATPDWDYMFETDMQASEKVSLPEHSIVYLDYTTDWTEDVAVTVEESLNDIIALILDEVAEGNTIAQLLNAVLQDNLYTEQNLVAIVELVVNAICALDENLRNVIDVVLDTDIASWFAMCEAVEEETVNEETGETETVVKYVCNKTWGIDEAAEEDKKDLFVAGLREVLAPANQLLAWLFFGDGYAFFTGTEKNTDGTYKYNDIIVLNGGHGYAYGLAPIFEALGCTMKSADAYKTEGGAYDAGAAVEDMLNALLAKVDEISADPIHGALDLLVNVIYFVNADGLTVSVKNLLAGINGIIAKLSSVITDGDAALTVEGLLADMIGFDISDLSMEALLTLAVDNGFVLNEEMAGILCSFYVGELSQFTAANGNYAYRMSFTDEEDYHDMLTIVLAFALDVFNLNSELFSDLLGEETYRAVYNLIRGAAEPFVYREMNWAYMYEGEDALAQLAANNLPARTGDAYTVYTKYQNNWNEATADYVNEILDSLVLNITNAVREDDSTVGQLLDNAISKGLYQDSILNSLIEMVVELLVDYEEIVAAAGVLLGAEKIADWFSYCDISTDANGETVVVCNKDWGIDSAVGNDAKRTAFVEGFVTALEPAYRLLAWLLFAEDYTFFNGTTNEPLITLTGAMGYDNAFVPLLEGVGAKMPGMTGTYADGQTAIKSADDFRDENGNIDMAQVVRDVFSAVTDWLYVICGDLADQENNGTVGTMFDMLPNFIYFVNADGLKVVVNNLLLPVNELLGHLEPMGVKVDFATIVEQIDITNVDWYAVQDLLIDVLDLYFPDYTIDFLSEFFIGQVVPFTSANGKTAYHMTYSEEETRKDMITCLISFVGDAAADERNAGRLIGWIGEDIYTIIYRYISDNAIEVGMQDYDWQLTSYAGTGEVLSPVVMGSIYDYVYGKYFTREMGEYMEANFPGFVDTMIHLLGIQIGESEVTYESLEEILDDFVGETVYKTEYLEMILAALKDLLANLSGSLDAELYEKIVVVVNTALGVDLTYWDNYTVAEITEGDRASFVNELLRMLKPFYPLLAWLLTDEDIAFFHSNDGSERDLIVIDGAEGYAYGIIPVMEALGCNDTTMTPAEFKAAAQNDPELLLRNVIDPILDKMDVILADPLNEIFDVLPGVIYFINCNGLDTAFQNIINAVLGVLANLEPAIGEVDIYELIGFDFKTINIENIIRQLLKDLETESGFHLEEVAMEAINELTVGEVVAFTSKNGDTAYTMQYAEGGDRADMITVVLRLALAFVSDRENVTVIKTMIKDDLSEDGYKFVCALLDNFADMAGNADGMDKILYTVYYIFYSAKAAADGVEGGYDNANDNYAFLNDLFEHSDVDFLKNLESSLGDFLDQNFEDILDRDELVPNGFIKLFRKLIDLFKQIAEWFKGLFD